MPIDPTSPAAMRAFRQQALSASQLNAPMLQGELQGLTDREQAEVVAGQLEATFVQMLMEQMRETVPESGLIEEGNGKKTFEAMLDQEYAQLAVGDWKFGFHEALVREIMRGPSGPQPGPDAAAQSGPDAAAQSGPEGTKPGSSTAAQPGPAPESRPPEPTR